MEQKSKESQFGTMPALKEERVWGMFDASMVNIGFAVATWCFLTGGTLALLVDFRTAVWALLGGNMLAVLLMSIASTLKTAKYGIDTYSSIITFAGKNGMKIILVVFVITCIGWIAILSTMLSRSAQNIYEIISGESSPEFFFSAITIISVVIVWLIVTKGPVVMKFLNRIVIPCLLFVMILMAYFILRDFGFGAILAAEPLDPYDNKLLNIIFAVELSLGAGLSWWPSMGGIARLTKSSRVAYWPNILGINLAASLAALLGMAAAFAIGGSDPTAWMIPLGGVALGSIALIFVIIANLTSNSIVMYTTCLGLMQFKLFANKKWALVTGALAVPIMLLGLWPEVVYGHYQTLLYVSAIFFGPLFVLEAVDYFIIRKQDIHLRSIYNATKSSRYYYWGGVNWLAIAVFVASCIVYTLILNPVTWAYSKAFPYLTASIPTIVFCFVAYYLVARFYLIPKNIADSGYNKADKKQQAV